MKVLALSDLHGEQRVLDGVRSLIAKRSYDAVFLAGDIADHGDAGYVVNLLDLLDRVPTFVIPGNMDDENVRDALSGSDTYIEQKIATFKTKYTLFGIGGGLRGPFHTPYEYYDDELWPRLQDVKLDEPSIVLSHTPPHGYFDDVGMDVHIGSRSVLKFMHSVEPFLLVCGHVHEHKGHLKSGNTNVVKLGPANKGEVAELDFSYTNREKSDLKISWLNVF